MYLCLLVLMEDGDQTISGSGHERLQLNSTAFAKLSSVNFYHWPSSQDSQVFISEHISSFGDMCCLPRFPSLLACGS